jgi:hypothetical protein
MVDKWDEASRKGEIPIRPVEDETGPKIVGPLGMPAKTVVKFITGPDDPPQIAIPAGGDNRWGLAVLIAALVFAFLFGAMAQYIWHFL